MANLSETPTYDVGVYQLETSDPVQGGPSGVSNAPLKNLANRTAYLKQRIDSIESGTTDLPGYAKLVSPSFTGSPTAPTQALGDNTTKIANTAFVQATVGGRLSKSVAGSGNVTLTAVEAGHAILDLSGALTGDRTVIVPTSPTRSWIVKNATSGAYALTVKTAAGTGVVVTQGTTAIVWTDGTNVYDALTDFDSPALTGIPTTPTAASGTNTTQIASTAFVQTAIAGVSAPPDASETVKGIVELATAAETTTGTDNTRAVHPAGLKVELDKKAPIASPTFTGDPKAPTAAQFDNDTSLASTAFVQRALGNDAGVVVVAANRTMTAADAGKYLFSNANNLVYTLPDPSGLALGSKFRITQGNLTSGGTINAPAGVTIGNITDGGTVSSVAMDQSTEYILTAVTATAYQLTRIAAGGGQSSLVGNGYQKLPSGLIIQWGEIVDMAADSTQVVTLPVAYTSFYRNFVSYSKSTSNTLLDHAVGSHRTSLSQIQITSGSNVVMSVAWMTIGV